MSDGERHISSDSLSALWLWTVSETADETRPRRLPRSPNQRLRLSHWRAMQEELIEQEHEKPIEAPSLAAPRS